MAGQERLSTFQVRVAQIFFELKVSDGFVVAGGAALLASDLIVRATQDIDLFTSMPATSVNEAKASFIRALERVQYDVEVIHDSSTFSRLTVRGSGEETMVDLAIDSPPSFPPTVTLLGPTLAPLELAGRKLLALFSRAEARDFADAYLLAERFGKEKLIEQAASMDAGFDLDVLAQMMRMILRFDDDEIPLEADLVPSAREFFESWSVELSHRPP